MTGKKCSGYKRETEKQRVSSQGEDTRCFSERNLRYSHWTKKLQLYQAGKSEGMKRGYRKKENGVLWGYENDL